MIAMLYDLLSFLSFLSSFLFSKFVAEARDAETCIDISGEPAFLPERTYSGRRKVMDPNKASIRVGVCKKRSVGRVA